MDGSEEPKGSATVAGCAKVGLVARGGRGRTGGSTGLDLWIQRGRYQGRRVKPLDGDLRSRTLSLLYPPSDEKGNPIRDAASAPPTDELPDIKAWLSSEFDSMVTEGVSRVLDLSGGDRVLQEYVRDLVLREFCQDFGVELMMPIFLGPEIEDFRHAIEMLVKETSPLFRGTAEGSPDHSRAPLERRRKAPPPRDRRTDGARAGLWWLRSACLASLERDERLRLVLGALRWTPIVRQPEPVVKV